MIRRAASTGLVLALSAGVALGLAACGDDEEKKDTQTKTTDAAARAAQADKAAIRKLVVDYGASSGAESCDFSSLEYLKERGGLEGCRKDAAEDPAVGLKVEDIRLNGDSAQATVLNEDGDRYVTRVTREGEPSDAYDGWKIAGASTKVEQSEQQPPAEEGSTSTGAESPTKPDTPELAAMAYVDCLRGRGARDIEHKRGSIPSVSFRAGDPLLFAQFRASSADAKDALKETKKLGAQFATTAGPVLLFSPLEPSSESVELAMGCLKEIGG